MPIQAAPYISPETQQAITYIETMRRMGKPIDPGMFQSVHMQTALSILNKKDQATAAARQMAYGSPNRTPTDATSADDARANANISYHPGRQFRREY